MPKKATVTIKPVAWHNDEVTMYQGFASWEANKDRTVQIIGDPAKTKKKALENLKAEYDLREEFMVYAKAAIGLYNPTKNEQPQ